eukprot:Skav227600  [mRNA]  locus=scaffold1141:292053:294774:+ [translate_table: standard]
MPQHCGHWAEVVILIAGLQSEALGHVDYDLLPVELNSPKQAIESTIIYPRVAKPGYDADGQRLDIIKQLEAGTAVRNEWKGTRTYDVAKVYFACEEDARMALQAAPVPQDDQWQGLPLMSWPPSYGDGLQAVSAITMAALEAEDRGYPTTLTFLTTIYIESPAVLQLPIEACGGAKAAAAALFCDDVRHLEAESSN